MEMWNKNREILFVQKLVNLLYFPKIKFLGSALRSVRVLGQYRCSTTTCSIAICEIRVLAAELCSVTSESNSELKDTNESCFSVFRWVGTHRHSRTRFLQLRNRHEIIDRSDPEPILGLEQDFIDDLPFPYILRRDTFSIRSSYRSRSMFNSIQTRTHQSQKRSSNRAILSSYLRNS